MSDGYKVDGSCVAAVVGNGNDAYIIGYSGGVYEDQDIWHDEIENSPHLDDIFGTDHPDKQGFYVWEGQLEPVYDDQPIFDGFWRPATKEDMAALIE